MTVTPLVGTVISSVLLAMLAACGGSATASVVGGGSPPGAGSVAAGPLGAGQANSTLPDPCALITRAQAEQAMGQPAAGSGKLSGGGSTERVCKYDEAQDGPGSVTLTLSGNPDTLKPVVIGQGAQAGANSEPVSALGDEAFYSPGLDILYVRKGNVAFLVQVASLAILQSGRGAGKDTVTQLATGVLAQI